MKRKLSWHFYAVLAIVLIMALAFTIYFRRREEKACELADLLVMQNAYDTALLLWHDRFPEEPEEYWYRPKDMRLIPASEPMPPACGMGSERKGGAAKAFYSEAEKLFDYSETEDYTDKSIRVTVSEENGALHIVVDWVQSAG